MKYSEYNAINVIRRTLPVPNADSIQFNDEFLLDTDEIGAVVANGVFLSKVDSQLVVTDERLMFAFGGREFFAEFDGMDSGFGLLLDRRGILSPP